MVEEVAQQPSRNPGVRRSPNIWESPAVYEIENLAFDRPGQVEAAMRSLGDGAGDWADRDVLDIGCGTGFHLPRFALDARTVIGVEPHPPLAAIARRRVRRLPAVSVVEGTAAALPIADASVDVAHARWAYFFGPGSEPGLAELARVVRPGGIAFVIDNDPTTSTFGGWFARGFPEVSAAEIESFWAAHGWSRKRITTDWVFDSREDLEAVVRIELPTAVAEDVLASYEGTEVDYAVNLWWRRF